MNYNFINAITSNNEEKMIDLLGETGSPNITIGFKKTVLKILENKPPSSPLKLFPLCQVRSLPLELQWRPKSCDQNWQSPGVFISRLAVAILEDVM